MQVFEISSGTLEEYPAATEEYIKDGLLLPVTILGPIDRMFLLLTGLRLPR